MKHNLSTLSVLHYVYGGLQCFGGFFMLFIVGLGHFLDSGWLQEHSHGEPPPPFLGSLFQIMGWVLFVVVEVWGIMNMVSGRNIARRRGRMLSMVVAGFDCLSIPFGTALGIFTLIALNDETVRAEYTRNVSPA